MVGNIVCASTPETLSVSRTLETNAVERERHRTGPPAFRTYAEIRAPCPGSTVRVRRFNLDKELTGEAIARSDSSQESPWKTSQPCSLVRGKADLPMQLLQTATLYFLLVFGAGFVLGIGRVLVAVPLLGERTAELLEMPLMLIVTVVAAGWIVRHKMDDHRLSATLSVGFIALGILLIAELAVGTWLRGMSAAEVFLNRDPVSGAAYYASLVLFAVMPAITAGCRQV